MAICPPGSQWIPSSQQCEYRGGGGPAPPGAGGGGPITIYGGAPPGSVYNQQGVDYGGRLVGYEGTLGLEGRDASNYIDPTTFLTAQAGRYNPDTGQFEGGYSGDYSALFGREDPIAVALGDRLLARGEGVADRTGAMSDLIAGQAGQVAAYGPAAAAAGNQAAMEMQRYADLTGLYSPAAVQAARQAAMDMRDQASAVRGFSDPAAMALSDYGGNQLALYGSQFQPIEEQIAQYASGYDTATRRAQEARRAQADVARNFEQQRRVAARELARYGVDPSMGRGQAVRERTAQAAAQAAAAEAARRAVEERGILLRGQAAGLGGQIAGRGTGAVGAGAQLGAQGAAQAANIQQGAGALEQQGLASGANIGATAANIAQGAGATRLSGLQTGANVGQQAGQLLTGAANVGQQGALTGSNIQRAGQATRMGAVPMLTQAQHANLQGGNIMQNWNQLIGATQGNRMGTPSGLVGAFGSLAGSALGSYMGGGGGIQGGGTTNAATGAAATGADGGYLYSTRQRFQDGGVIPSGTPANAWLMNSPARPVTGRTFNDGGEVEFDPRCQRIAGQLRMPDGTTCKPVRRVRMAEGGSVWPIIGTVAGAIIGGYFGGPQGAQMGAGIGGSVGSAVGDATADKPPPQQAGGGGGAMQASQLQATGPGQASLTPPEEQDPLNPQQISAIDTAAAEGGRVHGPSDGTGIDDQVPAQLSAGEYVIPADVVRKLGTLHFDKLLDKHHVPADMQRQQMEAVA